MNTNKQFSLSYTNKTECGGMLANCNEIEIGNILNIWLNISSNRFNKKIN